MNGEIEPVKICDELVAKIMQHPNLKIKRSIRRRRRQLLTISLGKKRRIMTLVRKKKEPTMRNPKHRYDILGTFEAYKQQKA